MIRSFGALVCLLGISQFCSTATEAAYWDYSAPTVRTFTMPATSTSLTVSGIYVYATDVTGFSSFSRVAGYKLQESSVKPLASAAGWSILAPVSYQFPAAGTRVLYAFAKDAAGNVSSAKSASVVITLSGDKTPPSVTAFLIPPTASTLTVPITTITGLDNVCVTGYYVSESNVAPLASSSGWSTTKPLSYTFASAGAKTLYARVKDAAGNVSASLSDTVTITPVTPTLGSVTVGWDAVTTYTDGSPQSDLVGYKVYYGTAPGVYSKSIMVSNPSALHVEIGELTRGLTYYFAVTAISTSGGESDYSNEVNQIIQ